MEPNLCICVKCRREFWGFRLANHEGAARDILKRVETHCLPCSRDVQHQEIAAARRAHVINEVKMMRATGATSRNGVTHYDQSRA